MDFLDKIYKKSGSVVSRKIANEFILIPIRQNVADLESIYTLNEVGGRIWELMDGKMTMRQIKKKIVEEFEVTAYEAEKDIAEYLQELEKIKAVIEI
jgi:hypothetical protein